MITALISVPSASSWTTCTFAVESLGASGAGFQPSDSSSPESGPYFDQVDPDLPAGPDIELTVTRPNLITLAATGTPSGGTYAVNLTSSGSGAAATISSWNSTSQNATITLGDPSNPDPTGAPSPGALASVSVAYQTTEAVDVQIPVSTFGMSCYIIASENDYWNGQSCTSTTIRGTTYNGTITNPPNLTGTFCNAFLQQVRLQGSGQSLGGLLIQYNTSNSTWQVVRQIVGADGTALAPGQTVARDRTIIPRGGVLVSLDSIGNGLLANDTGAAIKGYRLDMFNGFGQKAWVGFANPIVVGACSPGNRSCPGLTNQ
jgi:3D (Asp-Asp-Asp) domain-containing protein